MKATATRIGLAAAVIGILPSACAQLAPAERPTKAEPPNAGVEAPTTTAAVERGDCVDSLDVPLEQRETVRCSRLHAGELYEEILLEDPPDAPYPGDDDVWRRAEAGCLDAFEPFVGLPYERSIYVVMYDYPSLKTWTYLDDRVVLCFLARMDGDPSVGSANGSRQ